MHKIRYMYLFTYALYNHYLSTKTVLYGGVRRRGYQNNRKGGMLTLRQYSINHTCMPPTVRKMLYTTATESLLL